MNGGATTADRQLLFALTLGASAPWTAQCSVPAVGRRDANAPRHPVLGRRASSPLYHQSRTRPGGRPASRNEPG